MTTIAGVPAGWPTTEEEARAVQDALRARVVLDETGPKPGTGHVTGVDVAYDDERDLVAAAAVVLDAATLRVVAESTAVGRIAFPYVPGLLAFRELPAVCAALDALDRPPGLVVCDGYGLAHPRRFGLAAHLGVLTGLPALGVAKSPFVFRHGEVGEERGEAAPRQTVAYFCSNEHRVVVAFAVEAQAPESWDCPKCGLPASMDSDNPPPAPKTEPYKTHLAYVKERRSDKEAADILDEALALLRSRRKSGDLIF